MHVKPARGKELGAGRGCAEIITPVQNKRKRTITRGPTRGAAGGFPERSDDVELRCGEGAITYVAVDAPMKNAPCREAMLSARFPEQGTKGCVCKSALGVINSPAEPSDYHSRSLPQLARAETRSLVRGYSDFLADLFHLNPSLNLFKSPGRQLTGYQFRNEAGALVKKAEDFPPLFAVISGSDWDAPKLGLRTRQN
ncbi:hypothetical protein Bbelb_145840 [Branchiostoma belcheri]|nr:hypothetical protein Bbelb_145840 [Branchiostoma belcheri]